MSVPPLRHDYFQCHIIIRFGIETCDEKATLKLRNSFYSYKKIFKEKNSIKIKKPQRSAFIRNGAILHVKKMESFNHIFWGNLSYVCDRKYGANRTPYPNRKTMGLIFTTFHKPDASPSEISLVAPDMTCPIQLPLHIS